MKICGLDEVGRGALAGPLVAGAVIWPNSEFRQELSKLKLKDSKLLTKRQRENLYTQFESCGVKIVIEAITARQINNQGIGWANKEIFRRLIRKTEADKYIVDGPTMSIGRLRTSTGVKKKVVWVVKADQSRKCVMAAAIAAKVTRDRLMQKYHETYPKYGWDKNAGYGTKSHIEAIKQFGETRYHRSVFVTTALR